MSVPLVYVDANILIEFAQLPDLPWRQVFPSGPVELVVSRTTFEELDKFKDTPGPPRPKRERAKRTADALEKLFFSGDHRGAPVEIQKGVSVSYDDALVPRQFFDENELDYGIADDRFIASALCARGRTDREVRIVTDDGGARRTALRRGLVVVALPFERQADSSDPLVAENAELKRQLAAARDSKPKLSLRTADDAPQVSVKVWAPIPSTEVELESRMARIEARVREYAAGESIALKMNALLRDALDGFAVPSHQDIEAYGKERRDYFAAMRRELPALIERHNHTDLHAQVAALRLVNSGKGSAVDVTVHVRVAPPLLLRGRAPIEVWRLSAPMYPGRFAADIARLRPPNPVMRQRFEAWDEIEAERVAPTPPEWRVSEDGLELTARVGKIQPGSQSMLAEFFILYPSFREATKRALAFTIVDDAFRDDGTLVVEVEKRPIPRAEYAIGSLDPDPSDYDDDDE